MRRQRGVPPRSQLCAALSAAGRAQPAGTPGQSGQRRRSDSSCATAPRTSPAAQACSAAAGQSARQRASRWFANSCRSTHREERANSGWRRLRSLGPAKRLPLRGVAWRSWPAASGGAVTAPVARLTALEAVVAGCAIASAAAALWGGSGSRGCQSLGLAVRARCGGPVAPRIIFILLPAGNYQRFAWGRTRKESYPACIVM